MRLRRHFDLEESHGIDLAPMLDFVMNLLIFFIITAVFAKEIALMVNRPQGDMTQSEQTGEGGSIPIQILANGDILITESEAGRVFEATPDGRIAWVIVSKYDDKNVGWLTSATRYPESYADIGKTCAAK